MRLIIDGSVLVADHFSGIGHYLQGIVEQLDNDLDRPENQDVEVFLAVSARRVDRLTKYHFRNIKVKRIPLPMSVMRRLVVKDLLPPMDLFLGKGVYFFPDYNTWKLASSKAITTIHDLSFADVPEFVDDTNAAFLEKTVQQTIKRAAVIATVTETMRQLIIERYKLGDDRVVVTENAADLKEFYRRSPGEIAAVKRKYGIPGAYIYSMGNIEPRKNQLSLIEALRLSPQNIKDKYSLVLAGAGAWKQDELEAAVKSAMREGLKVIVLQGKVEDQDRAALYSGASMSAYVSYYEGFGMPIIESMAVRTPVIVSNVSVMPEVAGEAGVYIDPAKPETIASAYVEIDSWSSEELRRESEKGVERANHYNWANSSRTLVDAVRRIAK